MERKQIEKNERKCNNNNNNLRPANALIETTNRNDNCWREQEIKEKKRAMLSE